MYNVIYSVHAMKVHPSCGNMCWINHRSCIQCIFNV